MMNRFSWTACAVFLSWDAAARWITKTFFFVKLPPSYFDTDMKNTWPHLNLSSGDYSHVGCSAKLPWFPAKVPLTMWWRGSTFRMKGGRRWRWRSRRKGWKLGGWPYQPSPHTTSFSWKQHYVFDLQNYWSPQSNHGLWQYQNYLCLTSSLR